MHIMFVGDSMTIGSAGDRTWRYRMWQHLNRTFGGPYRFVGPRTALYDTSAAAPVSYDYGAPEFPERARRHLAGWGENWHHLTPVIRETVAEHRADLLLVSLGLIDLGFHADAPETAAQVRRFIEEARAANPSVRIAMLPVIQNIRAEYDPPFGAECDLFNELLAKTVADLDTPSSPLLLVPGPAEWDVHLDTYDGTHPSPSGEHRMAAAFAEALHQAWDVGGSYEGGR